MLPIYILNIQSQQKRRYLCEGALFAMQTPFKHVKHWWATDDDNFLTTREMCEVAIDDGFHAFQEYLDKGQHNEDGIAVFTQLWNYCRFWRHLIENNETAILIQDDRRMACTYPRLLEIYREIIKFDSDFQFMSLWCKKDVVNGSFSDRLPFRYIFEGSSIAHGIYENGACAGHIVTPEGAKVLLDIVPGYFKPRVEYAVSKYCQERKHFYTLVNEKENLKHLVNAPGYTGSKIFDYTSPDTFVRPLHTTRDP